MLRSLLTAVTTAALVVVGLSGCESAEQKAAEEELEQAASRTVCAEDAEPLEKPYGEGFPADFPFPPQTVVYDYEDRGDAGVIVTAVSATDFPAVLDFMNGAVVDAGFRIDSGETEEHDAEANWSNGDQRGRWAIQESADCPGQTVIQVLASAG